MRLHVTLGAILLGLAGIAGCHLDAFVPGGRANPASLKIPLSSLADSVANTVTARGWPKIGVAFLLEDANEGVINVFVENSTAFDSVAALVRTFSFETATKVRIRVLDNDNSALVGLSSGTGNGLPR